MRKKTTVKCPYCNRVAVKRPASVIYGEKNWDKEAYVYVCPRYPFCDSYVAAIRRPVCQWGRWPTATCAISAL